MARDFNLNSPIYLQVAQMIRDAIVSGDLPEGKAIPSVRQISVEQELNPQTVLNATRLLMEESILEKRRGIGIFVRAGARENLLKNEREKFRSQDVPEMVARAELLGLTAVKTAEIIKEAFKERRK